MQLSRRLIIAGAATAPLVLRHRAKAAGNPFTLGVASGEPSHDGFVIWTRLALEPLAPDGLGGQTEAVDVRYEIGADEAMRTVVRRGSMTTDPAKAHTVNVEITGLQSDRPYWYRFTAGGAASPIGRTHTAPAPGATPRALKLAVAACAHWETGWFSAYRHMAAENPDLVLFLGDYIYEFSYPETRKAVRRHDIRTDARTLAQYRNRYALHRTDPDLQTLHGAAPCLATWDDHEVENDYGADWSQISAVPPAEFAVRRMAAYQAFFEHMPLRPRKTRFQLYGRHNWGSLAQFSVLDGRQYRSRHACERPTTRRAYSAPLSCADLTDPTRSYLGFEQERWLYDGFAASPAAWNIIAQQQIVAPFAQTMTDGGLGSFTDTWSGFAANRTRMLDAIEQSKLKNPVFLGGDAHSFLATEMLGKSGARPVASEFVTTSVTSDGVGGSFMADAAKEPNIKFCETAHRGYLAVDITSRRMETRMRTISDREDPMATVSTLKQFVVEAGKPGVSG